MKRVNWITTSLLAATVLVSVSGCGNSSNMDSNSLQTTGESSSQTLGNHRGAFQPTIDMKVNPSTPTAGKPFTLTFSMERPHRSGNQQGNGGRHWSGNGGNLTGNWTGGQGRQGGWGGNAPQQPTATAQITGNSVNQTVNLTNQNREFEGTTTIQKPGTYQVVFTMDIDQRQIKHQFTIKVSN